jgi:hypothetical protein
MTRRQPEPTVPPRGRGTSSAPRTRRAPTADDLPNPDDLPDSDDPGQRRRPRQAPMTRASTEYLGDEAAVSQTVRRHLPVPTRLPATGAVRLAAASALLAVVPRALTAGHFRTWDETLWMARSLRFSGAAATGNAADASASAGWDLVTMPGVTTMWIGSAARAVWSGGRQLGLWAGGEGSTFDSSRSGLALAQLGVAVVTAALTGILVLLVAAWAGQVAAGVAGVLVATEPFLVAHGAVLHTDELMTLSGVAALLAAALVLGVPTPTRWCGDRRLAVASGALFGFALLTKVSAVFFLPGAVLLAGWAVVRASRRGTAAPGLVRDLRRPGAGWLAAAAGVTLAGYPALWLAPPLSELAVVTLSLGIGAHGHSQFFLGSATQTPGPLFYLVAIPFRMTPVFLAATAAATVAVCWRRAARGQAAVLAGVAGPPLAVVSVAPKQFDRYALPVLVVAAIAVGIAAGPVVAAARRRWGPALPAVAGGLAAVALAASSVAVAPWGLAYYNPALGGGAAATRTMLVGWGEGLEQAGALIERREAGRCDTVTIHAYYVPAAFPCGSLVSMAVGPDAEELAAAARTAYVVLYVSDRQTRSPAYLAELVRGRELLGTVTERGIRYAEVFGPRAAPPGAAAAGGRAGPVRGRR